MVGSSVEAILLFGGYSIIWRLFYYLDNNLEVIYIIWRLFYSIIRRLFLIRSIFPSSSSLQVKYDMELGIKASSPHALRVHLSQMLDVPLDHLVIAKHKIEMFQWIIIDSIQVMNGCRVETLDAELFVWPHEVEPWFHSWYRGSVETLDAKYNLILR